MRTFGGMKKSEILGISIVSLLILIVLPLLNAFVPEGNPFYISNVTLNLYGKYLTYAVLALGVDVLWGYTGLLSLGQCLFFSLGGYAFGMYLIVTVGKLDQGQSELPDSMAFLGYSKLPEHWAPFENIVFALSMVILVPAVVAYIFGYLAFRSRIKGVYFSILTQALTYVAFLLFFQNDLSFGDYKLALFGGNNGLTDFKFILGHDVNSPATRRVLYILSGVLLLAAFLFSRWLTTTKFGKVQRAVRDSENRVLFSGYATANFKLFVFVYAAVISGLAGALYAPQVGIINPSEMSTMKSLEAVVWVAIGGRGTLVGPIIGAVSVNALKNWATRAYPDYWLIMLGGLFVFVVLFMPKGIVGIPNQVRGLIKKYSSKPPETPEALPAKEDSKPA